MSVPETSLLVYAYIGLSLLVNAWLVLWAYGNWKSSVQSTNVESVHLVPKESYDLDQDEKDFYGIK